MKNLFALLSCCLLSAVVSAQTVYHTIKRDTINISGYIYDNTGRPLKSLVIESHARDLKYDRLPNSAITDSTGHFTINGAQFNDTLYVATFEYQNVICYNKGSRYLVISLSPRVTNLTATALIQVTAIRKHRVKTPTFKVEDFNAPICVVENPPQFPGGNEKFGSYINKKLYYPQKAVGNNIEGMVKVRFTIEKDGSIVDPKIIQGIGYGCDEAVTVAIKQSPKWKPGQIDGRSFKTQYEVSVQFMLSDK